MHSYSTRMEKSLTPALVRQKADDLRVTLGDVLTRANVQRSTFWRWEQGETESRSLTVLKISDALAAIEAERAA